MVVNFLIKAVTMTTSRLMTSKYFPQFDENSFIFILSFGEIFSYFSTSWKWHCLTFWSGKKSRLFRWFFQYSVICHCSKYMRLVLTDCNKNRVFNRNCMWLQLSQILKKFTEGNARKLAFIFTHDVTKIRKTRVVSRAGIHLGARSCHAMYRMRESKRKLELFYRLFIDFFVVFFWP